MFELKPSITEEIRSFVKMESSIDTTEHIIPYSSEKHATEMQCDDVVYLSIYQHDQLSGFMILATDVADSVELRWIVIAEKGQGLGQKALHQLEDYCTQTLGCPRIWLDVFESNTRGQYIYQKLGYTPFKTGEYNGRLLLFMEKHLS